jgi:hypothetical protein
MPDIYIPAFGKSFKCKEIRVLVSRSAVSGLALGSCVQMFQTDFELVGFEVSSDDPDSVWLDLERLCPSQVIQLNLFNKLL